MSSMRNVIQRRNHRERAQPLEREKWGILEKHKDYSLRAKDFNQKKARLKVLRQKADERNPDEFNYGMLSSTSNKGRKVADRGNKALSHDAVKLLKTQDAGYLRNVIQETSRAIGKLEEEFMLEGDADPQVLGKDGRLKQQAHVVFAGSEEEQKRVTDVGPRHSHEQEPGPSMDMEVQQEAQIYRQKSRKQAKKEADMAENVRLTRERYRKEQNARRTRLDALKTRYNELMAADRELDLQRAQMNHAAGGVTKTGKKWQVRERKK